MLVLPDSFWKCGSKCSNCDLWYHHNCPALSFSTIIIFFVCFSRHQDDRQCLESRLPTQHACASPWQPSLCDHLQQELQNGYGLSFWQQLISSPCHWVLSYCKCYFSANLRVSGAGICSVLTPCCFSHLYFLFPFPFLFKLPVSLQQMRMDCWWNGGEWLQRWKGSTRSACRRAPPPEADAFWPSRLRKVTDWLHRVYTLTSCCRTSFQMNHVLIMNTICNTNSN